MTFGVLVGTRAFFNPDLAREGRRLLLSKLEAMGYNAVVLPADSTPTGVVETVDDAKKCAALFREHAQEIDGIIVSLPNFGDEIGIVTTLKGADLRVPILVQASDDDVDKVDLRHRRDAFCGKLSVCNNLYNYGIPFSNTSLHTCSISSTAFTEDLQYFASVCRVVRGLKGARIGAIGARPAAFQTMRVSERLLQASGITVVPVDLSEIIFATERLDEKSAEVSAKIEEIRAYGKIPSYIKSESVVKNAKLSLTISNWVRANELDAFSVQCWSSIQLNYGCATCTVMSMMGEELIPGACEVDIAGAISMYALSLTAGKPAALLDWNNNYGDDRDMCVCTHCGNFPKGFVGGEIEISELDVLGETLGRDKSFGAIKGKVKAGPMTYFRMSTDDLNGRIRAYVGEGEFTDDPFPMAGGIAVCRVPKLQSLMDYLCGSGFEHHTAMVRGHHARAVNEAVTKYLNWSCHNHGLS
ncbi:MAG TPA: fucose isomerase [Spirochaetia bacterium]|nr:fucose isomerase [Spirochaetia bacterium]